MGTDFGEGASYKFLVELGELPRHRNFPVAAAGFDKSVEERFDPLGGLVENHGIR